MLVKLSTALRDHRGEEMRGGDDADAPIMTLGFALERACMFGQQQSDAASDKFKQYKLAQRIAAASGEDDPPADFSSEDITLLKTLAASIFAPIAYGAVEEALESPAQPEPPPAA